MAVLGAIWMVVGLAAIIILCILSLLHVVKWKVTGIVALIAIVGFFLIVLNIGSSDDKEDDVQVAKLVYSKDDKLDDGSIAFDTNGNGKCTIKVKGLVNGTAVVKNNDDEYQFKDQVFSVKKGKITKVTIRQSEKQAEHNYVLDEGAGHKKKFAIFGGTKLNNDDDSESSDDDSESGSTSNNKTLASSLTQDFSESGNDILNNVKVSYHDSIFYVTVPDNVTVLSDNEQLSLYRSIVKAIHSKQRQPTGVVYFVDSNDSIIAETKTFNNTEVTLK